MNSTADASAQLIRAGTSARERDALVLTPESCGWKYTGLEVVTLAASERRTINLQARELLVLPLRGSADLLCDGGATRVHLHGRPDVFAGVSDSVYLPPNGDCELVSEAGGEFALCWSRAEQQHSVQYLPAETVSVETRGAGSATRQLNNFFAPSVGSAHRLVVVEVLTPEGNTSSYPPHKHDAVTATGEAVLEEIYYYRFAHPEGMGVHRTYALDGEPFDVTFTVRDGDAVLVPRGYHGPCTALPGYDMYYLNVLAGPGPARSLGFTDDPAHAWIRGSWTNQTTDPRVPMTPRRQLAAS